MKKIISLCLAAIISLSSSSYCFLINTKEVNENEDKILEKTTAFPVETIDTLAEEKDNIVEKVETEVENIEAINEQTVQEQPVENITIAQEPVQQTVAYSSVPIEQQIINKCNEYGVDPYLALGIARLETGHFTSYAFTVGNNPGGLCSSGGPIHFASVEEGVEAFVGNLYRNYIAVGLTTPELINPKYCPGNLNWASLVRSLMY